MSYENRNREIKRQWRLRTGRTHGTIKSRNIKLESKTREGYALYMKQYNKLEDVVIKNKARQFTRSQIKKGLIVRGDCVVSGCDLTTEAHHEDYSKPLEIMWLCKAHHEQHHHGGINNLEINL